MPNWRQILQVKSWKMNVREDVPKGNTTIREQDIDTIIDAVKNASSYFNTLSITHVGPTTFMETVHGRVEESTIIELASELPNIGTLFVKLGIFPDERFWKQAKNITTIIEFNILELRLNNQKSKKQYILEGDYVPEGVGLDEWGEGTPAFDVNDINDAIEKLKGGT